MNHTRRLYSQCILIVGAALMSIPAVAQELPWALRNHYSFPAGTAILQYAEESALWRVMLSDETVVIDDVGFEIELDDGTVLNATALGKGTCVRAEITGDLGESNSYTVTFPEKNGLTVTHRLTRYGNRLFLVMDLMIKNTSTTPIKVASVLPAVLRGGNLTELGENATVSTRSLVERGGGIVIQQNGGGGLMLLHAPAKSTCLAVGLLPTGRATLSGGGESTGTEWGGRFESHYAPSVTIEPGETLVADRLWISHGTPDPQQVDLEYAWIYSTLERPVVAISSPITWVSVPDSEGLDTLADWAREWQTAGIRHALIPRYWEGRPGSLKGGAPGYPKNIAAAIETLRKVRVSPGITVDPLQSDDGKKEWAVRSQDGRVWLDLSHPDGMEFAVKRLKKLFDEGFDFVGVARSAIPDQALLTYGQSRADADRLAFEAARKAAGRRPVYAVAEAEFKLDRDSWRAAGAAASRLVHYQVAPGAVRLSIDKDMKYDEEIGEALRLWPGSIEIVGKASSSVRKKLADVFRLGPLYAYPIDAANVAPSIWQDPQQAKAADERTDIASASPQSTQKTRP